MSLAFVICAHKNPAQVGRMVTALAGPSRHFFIHIDKKAPPAVHAETAAAVSGVANVRFLESHNCNWWDFGQVKAALKGITAVVEQNIECSHLIFLTGQDYPIKPNTHIDEVFRLYPDRSFLSYSRLPFPLWEDGGIWRYKKWHFTVGDRVIALPNGSRRPWYQLASMIWSERQLPSGLEPYAGWAYWCLARKAVEYTYEAVRRRPELVSFFRHVLIPDEMFFQTLLLNSPLADTIVNTDLRYVSWPDTRATHPVPMTIADLPALLASGALIARKFDMTTDSVILDTIDRQILKNPDFHADPHHLPAASLPVGQMSSAIV